jgi:N utilization substance protein B
LEPAAEDLAADAAAAPTAEPVEVLAGDLAADAAAVLVEDPTEVPTAEPAGVPAADAAAAPAAHRGAGKGSRSAGRRRAVELVFEAFSRGLALGALLRERSQLATTDWALELPDAAPLGSYTVQLVEGVAARQAEISEWLDTYSQRWPQSRMPAVDRAILYVGAYEVVFEDDVPDEVILKGSADLAAKLSTAKSADFVSGLLGRLSKIKDTLL